MALHTLLLRVVAGFTLASLARAADPLWMVHNPSPPAFATLTRAVTGTDGRMAALYQFSSGLAATDNGVTWRWERTANPYALTTDLIYANGQWVAVSGATNVFGQTAIQTSPDLRNWSLTVINTPRILTHIAYGGGKYWGIQANFAGTSVYSSTDAVNWAAVAGHNLTGTYVRDLVYSTDFNRLVASVDNTSTNRVLTSSDGVTWTERLVHTNGYVVLDLAAANGAVIGIGSGAASVTTNIFRSTDGVAFTNVIVPGTAGGPYEVTYGRANEWVIMAVSSTGVRSTNNGVTWTNVLTGYSGNAATTLSAITYRASEDRYYSMGNFGFVASTANFTNPWTRVQQGTNASFVGVVQGVGRVVAANSGTNLFLAAAGSTNWVMTNVPNGTFTSYQRLQYLNGNFIALSGSTRSARSTDGINFTAATMNAQVQRIVWNGAQYLGTRDGFTNFLTSADSVTWTTNTSSVVPFNKQGKLYRFNNEYVYIAQPIFGELNFGKSTDLVNWSTNGISYFGDFLYDFVEAGGKLYYPFSGGVLISSDGLNFTNIALSGSSYPTEAGATVVSNRLYALNGNPSTIFRIIYSDNGTNWLPVEGFLDRYPAGNPGYRMAYDGTRLVAGSQRGTLASVALSLSGAAAAGDNFTSWRNQFTFPPGQDNDVDDPDGDGLANIVEFAFGSNPTNSASGELPKIAAINDGGIDYPSVSFIRNKNATGLTLSVTAAGDVTFGSALSVTQATGSPQDLGNGLERVTYRTTTPSSGLPTAFFNIRVMTP